MKLDEFIAVVKKVKSFRTKLTREGIAEETQQVILKVYIEDMTNRINTDLLKVL